MRGGAGPGDRGVRRVAARRPGRGRREAAELGRGVGAQVALARRDSPNRGGRHLGLAQALVREMPHTLALLQAGLVSEWRATILVRETACLSREDRAQADAELADRLPELGDLQTELQARAIAYRLDPAAFMARVRGAVADRRVTCRPAPDTMARLSGLLPAALGVAAYATLRREADTLKAAGDQRSRDQLMADLFFTRLTAQPDSGTKTDSDSGEGDHRDGGADANRGAATDSDADEDSEVGDVPVEVQLVMTDKTLFGGDDEPALLQGYGPIPAALARRLVRDTKQRGVAAPALHPPQRWCAGRDGLATTDLSRRVAPVAGHPGSDVSHPVV